MKKTLFAVSCLAAIVAYAADNPDPVRDQVDQFRWRKPQFFNQSLNANFVDAGVVNAATLVVNGSPVAIAPVSWSCDYDFPSIASGYCSVSNGKPCTVTGLTLGSSCTIGVAQAAPADAGSAFYAGGAILQAIARGTNLLEIEICNRLGDGGAIDIADAGYHGVCFN